MKDIFLGVNPNVYCYAQFLLISIGCNGDMGQEKDSFIERRFGRLFMAWSLGVIE